MNFNDKVVYQIYPKSFLDSNNDGIGDIQGIIKKLDYLQQLQVDYIWLSPINCSPQNDNGYDISDYYQIDPMFGTLSDYKQLIDQAAKRDIKVMLDLVLNHTSNQHQWFQKALNGDPKYFDYYVWADKPNDIQGFFSSNSWEYVPELNKYYLHLFDKTQPDLNWHNPEVRKELYKMINFWIDFGVEGFRLDVIDLIAKEPEKLITGKGPKFYEYLKELNQNTFGDRLLTVGECWNSSLDEAKKMCNKSGLSEIFHFTHLTLTNGEDKWDQKKLDYNQLVDIIYNWQNNYDGNQTQVMNNHDMPRLISLWLDDQQYRYQSATLLATLFTLLNGTQYIYQGEEVGLTNAYMTTIDEYNDVETFGKYEELKNTSEYTEQQIMKQIMLVSRDNARIPMAWNDSIYGGFSEIEPWLKQNSNYKEVNIKNDLDSPNSIYEYYKQLISFKKQNYQKYINHHLDDISYEKGILMYSKKGLTVVCNMTENRIDFPISKVLIFNNYEQYNGTLQPYQALVTID